ncbi:unnamed protein product [marine sediment metagenome]|uniref:Uncharacterized protein n=1 Tax=marine sediment metagenome TaxID=412755 RepID=X1VES9_9ZZZZ
MRRQPQISQGQINRGLCGIRGCPNPASKYKLAIESRKVQVCQEHHRKENATKKAAIKTKQEKERRR